MSSVSTDAERLASESTAAYFDQIDSQTPAEMSERIPAPAARSAMPGSAHLPGDIVKPSRQRRLRSARKAKPDSDERTPSSRVALRLPPGTFARELVLLPRRLRARTAQLRPARLPAAVGSALLLAAGTGVATVVATQVSGRASVKRSAAHRVTGARLAVASRGHAVLRRLPVRTRVRHATSHAKRAVRHRAPRRSTPPTAPANTTAAVASAPTSAAVSSGSAQQPVTQSPPTGGGSSTPHLSSSSSSRPSFGANGILGPGHSPNG